MCVDGFYYLYVALVVVRPDCESEDSVPSFNGYNISSGHYFTPYSIPSCLHLSPSHFLTPDLLGQPPALWIK